MVINGSLYKKYYLVKSSIFDFYKNICYNIYVRIEKGNQINGKNQ